jgi:NarL family two-component system response regulator LiaR
MTDLLRILIADDHMVVRRGLCSLLIPRNGMEVIGEAADGVEAVELARSLQPDVILMDMVMPHLDGPEAVVEIKKENPEARILILTSFGEDARVSAAIRAGALGYLLKDSSPDELFHAIREVAQGNLSLPPQVAMKLMQDLQKPKRDRLAPETALTQRELDVLRGIAQGLSNQDIAGQLMISQATVRSHVSSLLSKLGLTNRTQAALYAVEAGLLERGKEETLNGQNE